MRNRALTLTIPPLLALAIVSACTATRNARIVDLKSPKAQVGTALILGLDFRGPRKDVFAPGCDFSLRQLGSNDDWRFQIKPGMNSVFLELPPGTYAPSYFTCSTSVYFEFRNWPANIHVRAGKVSYGGFFSFEAAEARKMSVGILLGNSVEREELAKLIDRSPSDVASRFVSSWTGKPITKQTLMKSYSGIEANWRLSGKDFDRSKLTGRLRDCESAEFSRNKVMYGALMFTGYFTKGTHSSTIVDGNAHTYSEDFIECVKSSMKSFAPGNTEAFSVKVSI